VKSPLIALLALSAQLTSIVILPRIGPKVVVPFDMVLAASGMTWLTRRSVSSHHASGVLPPLLVVGFGLGQITTSALQVPTLGVNPVNAGGASATMNTSQLIGGSVVTALLSTLTLAATTDYLTSHPPVTHVVTNAAAAKDTTPPAPGEPSPTPKARCSPP